MYILKQLIHTINTSIKKQASHSIRVIGFAEDWQLSSADTLDDILIQIDGLTTS